MNWYLQGLASATEEALHLVDNAVALGDDSNFSCPLPIPQEVRANLVVLLIEYISLDGAHHFGQLVVHKGIERAVREIFEILLFLRFPIANMAPISSYGWNDEASMAANNTSAFNYRNIDGDDRERLSWHAYGLAIDINPLFNPCLKDGTAVPSGAFYQPLRPGTITANSDIVALFRAYGFEWGGAWETPKDYQHFQFPHQF